MSYSNFRKSVLLIAASVCFLNALCVANPLRGQEIDQVAAHVDDETSAIFRIDSNTIVALINGEQEVDEDHEQTVLEHRLNQTHEILGDDPVWLTVGFPQTPLSVQVIISDPDDTRINALKELWEFPRRATFGGEQQFVFRRLSEPQQPQRPVNAARLAQWKKLMAPPADTAEGEGVIRFACLPPAHLYDTYRELEIELPKYFGGGPITLLTEGLQNVSGTIDVKTGALSATIDSTSPAAATSFAKRVTELKMLPVLATIEETPRSNQLLPLIGQLGRSTFSANDSQVRWQVPANKQWQRGELLKLAFGSAFNRSAINRLRSLALCLLNYESAYSHFPRHPKVRGPKESPGLSWRVLALPFMEDEMELYNKFALDEPWDSPTNIKLLPEMPSVYSDYGSKLFAPVSAKPGYTTVVAPISENTILGSPRKVTFSAITDGSSNTILLVTVKDKHAVPWTAPQDYEFDPNKPAAGLKFSDGRVPVVFGDGSTSKLVEDNDWVRLFEMNDGGVAQAKE